MTSFPRALGALPLALLVGCTASSRPIAEGPPLTAAVAGALVEASPAAVGMRATLGDSLDAIMRAAIADTASPGAALAVGRHGRLVHVRGYGRLDTAPGSAAVDAGTIYDMASLTKVVGTTTAAMIAEEQGLIDLDQPLSAYLPGIRDPAKASVTVRMIVAHRAGFESGARLYTSFKGRDQYLEQIDLRPLAYPPGTRTIYSDWDFVLMQLILEKVTGQPLDRFMRERVWGPLGMNDTGWVPDASLMSRIAPTEIQAFRGGKIHGEVHDENAWAIGGVAGHAGLFSSARDLAVFAQMMLNGGTYNGVRILKPETIARWTSRQYPGSSRALGWDTPAPGSSAGRFLSPRAFGHTGFTGTSIWIDPQRDLFVVLLSNRVNPTRDNQKISAVRRSVADAVSQGIVDAPLVPWEERLERQ